MKLILLGAPGAGKGTQSAFIKDALKVPVISTGNLLREAIAQGTELGKQAKAFMDNGQLVPDELIIGLVKEKLESHDCDNGAIFDGFPRTVAQAEAMAAFSTVDVALSFEVPDEVIIKRMAGRRTCPKCHAVFHVEDNPPKVEGICDNCGEALGIRHDDDPEVVAQRLNVYHEQTEPVKGYYEQLGKLKSVEGVGPVDEIRSNVFAVLGLNV